VGSCTRAHWSLAGAVSGFAAASTWVRISGAESKNSLEQSYDADFV